MTRERNFPRQLVRIELLHALTITAKEYKNVHQNTVDLSNLKTRQSAPFTEQNYHIDIPRNTPILKLLNCLITTPQLQHLMRPLS